MCHTTLAAGVTEPRTRVAVARAPGRSSSPGAHGQGESRGRLNFLRRSVEVVVVVGSGGGGGAQLNGTRSAFGIERGRSGHVRSTRAGFINPHTHEQHQDLYDREHDEPHEWRNGASACGGHNDWRREPAVGFTREIVSPTRTQRASHCVLCSRRASLFLQRGRRWPVGIHHHHHHTHTHTHTHTLTQSHRARARTHTHTHTHTHTYIHTHTVPRRSSG
jgi:hypothetical protein